MHSLSLQLRGDSAELWGDSEGTGNITLPNISVSGDWGCPIFSTSPHNIRIQKQIILIIWNFHGRNKINVQNFMKTGIFIENEWLQPSFIQAKFLASHWTRGKMREVHIVCQTLKAFQEKKLPLLGWHNVHHCEHKLASKLKKLKHFQRVSSLSDILS